MCSCNRRWCMNCIDDTDEICDTCNREHTEEDKMFLATMHVVKCKQEPLQSVREPNHDILINKDGGILSLTTWFKYHIRSMPIHSHVWSVMHVTWMTAQLMDAWTTRSEGAFGHLAHELANYTHRMTDNFLKEDFMVKLRDSEGLCVDLQTNAL